MKQESQPAGQAYLTKDQAYSFNFKMRKFAIVSSQSRNVSWLANIRTVYDVYGWVYSWVYEAVQISSNLLVLIPVSF